MLNTTRRPSLLLLVATCALSACGGDATSRTIAPLSTDDRSAEQLANANPHHNTQANRDASVTNDHLQGPMDTSTLRTQLAEMDFHGMFKAMSNESATGNTSNARTSVPMSFLTANHNIGFATANFSATTTGVERELKIDGRAIMRRSQSTTHVSVQLTGLTPDAVYNGHIHNLPCNINGGGAHYK